MTVSNTKRIGIKKYQQEKCDRITADIPKGKREEYKQAAARLGLSLSMLIQNSVESFAGLDGESLCPAPTERQPAEKLSGDQKRLVEEFSRLPVDAQKSLLKFLRSINAAQNQPD